MAETLEKIQAEYQRVIKDKTYLENMFRTGAERADRIAQRTLAKVQKKVGFVPR